MNEAVYKFGRGINTGMFDAHLVGGKGAKLAEMGSLDLPVPPGITITTEQCNQFLNADSTLTQDALIANLVDVTLHNFNQIVEDLGYMPLVSVRSGSRVSMPGMMDTILNVGISKENFDTWCDRLGADTAEDCYKRFLVMYAEVVLGIPRSAFDTCLTLVSYFSVYDELTGELPPQTIEEQLAGCIKAVFLSWHSERAVAYRAIHGYPDDWGTAVTVQQMVFGNRNDKSATGVLFTRDFNTGEATIVGDWLPNAQGEDVVAGTHDTKSINLLGTWQDDVPMEDKCYFKLLEYGGLLENHYKDMQDIEFTIDDGELFILQTRDGKRSALAAFKIAWDMHTEGLIKENEALARVTGKQYIALQNPTIDPTFTDAPDFEGIGASGSIVSGIVVLSSKDAIKCTMDCILVTKETTPKDFPGMAASVGILTKTGGITSHAAVVARGMDKTCVVGAENLKFVGTDSLEAGQNITINGETGEVWVNKTVPVVAGQVPAFVEEMIGWVDTKDDRFLSVLPESVPAAETVYVDVSGSLDTLKSLTAALTAVKDSGADGILGFGRNDAIEKVDSEFMGFFGISGQTYDDGTYGVIEKTLIKSTWAKKFKRSWTLHLPGGTDGVLIEVLRAHGWKVVTVVDSFKAALSVDGYVVMDEKFQERLVEEGLTFSVIEELLIKTGAEVKELPARVTKERQLFDVLGG